MSDLENDRPLTTDQEIDISTSRLAGLWQFVVNWGIWFGFLLACWALVTAFDADMVLPLIIVFAIIAAFVSFQLAWYVVGRRGVFTWLRQANKPALEFARGNKEAAELAFARALTRSKVFAPEAAPRGLMLFVLAQYAWNQGRHKQAAELFEESTAILGKHRASIPIDYFTALNNHAICFIYLRDFQSAISILEKTVDLAFAARKPDANKIPVSALQLQGIECVLHINLALLFIQMREMKDAKAHLDETDVLLPTLDKPTRAAIRDHQIAIWALWYYWSERVAEAEEKFATASDPDHRGCLRVKAKLLIARREFAEAEVALNKFRDQEMKIGTLHRPGLEDNALDLAECQYGQGNIETAFASLDEARAIVADFAIHADQRWFTTLKTWLERARQHEQSQRVDLLQAELQSLSAMLTKPSIAITDRFRQIRVH